MVLPPLFSFFFKFRKPFFLPQPHPFPFFSPLYFCLSIIFFYIYIITHYSFPIDYSTYSPLLPPLLSLSLLSLFSSIIDHTCHHVMSLCHDMYSIFTGQIRLHMDNIYVRRTNDSYLLNQMNMKSVIKSIAIVNDGLTVRIQTKSNKIIEYNFVKKSIATRYYCSLVY